jgi:citronellol/citronellal dehydrogenase
MAESELLKAEKRVLRGGLLCGKTALVTGAGSGIGRAISIRLASLGAYVCGVGRRRDKLEETASLCEVDPGRFEFEPCDVRDTEAIESIMRSLGDRMGLDLLVNNAGGQFYAPALKISRKGWDSVIDLNLSAVFTVIKAAYPYLKSRRGAVINISLSGVDRGSMGLAHSIAARAGVLGLTRSLALEWAKDGIRLNCIAPGVVLTESLTGDDIRPMLAKLTAATPMGILTSVEEVAELTAFLASPAGGLMTGQLIQIDGAAHIGPGLHLIDA